ncbi:NAD(P)H-binding protein [Nocardia jiangxiensis]|uniref:NAD(P)H-binding protein n=1 Tax=Nocardia jiangxiensis TaxID=282685 RepID=UPI0003138FBA|nr:NAD(P)H-binding protein [Nocardia jiangxiensis]
MILVTGATGTVGRAVVDHLLASGVPVRALTRRPETAALPEGVDVVRGDPADPNSVDGVMAGVDRVFLLTTGPDLAAHDATLARAAADAGVSHVVKLSSGRTGDPAADDPIPTWHRAGEQAVRASGVAWTMLRPLGFMSNALHWAGTVRTQDTVRAPFGQGRIAVIDPEDIAAVATVVLTESGHDGRIRTLSGPEPLSPADQTAILAEVLDRPLRYAETTPSEARAGLLGADLDETMADAVMALRATALEAFTSVVHPDVEEITGRAPRTFRDWARAHRDEFATA